MSGSNMALAVHVHAGLHNSGMAFLQHILATLMACNSNTKGPSSLVIASVEVIPNCSRRFLLVNHVVPANIRLTKPILIYQVFYAALQTSCPCLGHSIDKSATRLWHYQHLILPADAKTCH